jgi:hypothetical protein
VPECAEDLVDEELRRGQVFSATVDSSWLHTVDRAAFASELDRIRAREPTMAEQTSAGRARFFDGAAAGCARRGPRRAAFVGPDHGALELMLSGATG